MSYYSRHGGWVHKVTDIHRSGLEDRVSAQLENAGIDVRYEKYIIPYTVPASSHTYTPDFVLPNGVIVETKGRFSPEDRAKHLLVKEQHPNLDIRFVFSRSTQKLYKGSKSTYADWCIKHGFKYADKWIPESWWKEKKKSTTGLVQKKGENQ